MPWSSSVSGGYVIETSQIGIEGYHIDGYGDSFEVPMQGPFAQEHVGGFQHRHIPLNSGTLDDSDERPEAWEIVTTPVPKIKFQRRQGTRPTVFANYRRDEFAKRPVNIRNIQSSTGSTILGNYDKISDVVQTMGRSTNNAAFVKNEGFGSSSTASPYVGSANDYARPNREKYGHVFVNRFSAPGGPETAGDADGGPFLDLDSGQAIHLDYGIICRLPNRCSWILSR